MKKISKIIFIIIFIAIILIVPAIIFISKDREFSDNENRYLSQKPKLIFDNIISGKYFQDVESYINDQFILRDKFYEIKTDLQILSGNKDINGVYLAKDNYLIEKHLPEDFDEDRFNKNINSINKFAEKNQDKNIDVMIVPTAELILKDKLPKNADTYNQNEALDKIKTNLTNARFIDVRDNLLKHKDEEVYYRTDHHWTSLGSYYAYEELCRQNDITASLENYNRRCVTNEFKGSLYSKVLKSKTIPDKIEIFDLANNNINYKVSYNFNKSSNESIYGLDKLNEKDKYQVFLGGNYPELKIETDNKNNKNLLVIKDSYANSFIPFITKDYEDICVVDMRYFKGKISEYMSENNITDVLILYNIQNFSEEKSITNLSLY